MRISQEKAHSYLKASHPVAIPTETVWGLAARLHDEVGIQAIFSLKKRPLVNPLIIHIHDISSLREYAQDPLPPGTIELANAFWPGPLTLVLPCRQDRVPALARAHLPTAGFRVPNESATLELLKAVGPLVAPSANLSGRPSATEMSHVEEDFGNEFPCLATDETCHFGVESTILVFQEGVWRVGRLGALPLEAFIPILGYLPLKVAAREKPLCPGQHFRHYAPQAKLILSRSPWQSEWKDQCDAVLGFQDRVYAEAPSVFSFGASSDPMGCQRELYRSLRLLDVHKTKTAWVDCSIAFTPPWETFMDRLVKATSL